MNDPSGPSTASSEGLRWERRPEGLHEPVLVATFEGWNDAADAASSAGTWLTQHGTAVKIASIDPEVHLDFQARRPQAEIVGGVAKAIVWPRQEFFQCRFGDHDLVVLRGLEPSYRWRAHCALVLEVARETGCRMVVTLGALLADVPHTRPPRVTGSSTDRALSERLGLEPSRYEGPTGIVGVLNDACRHEPLPALSLWAPVPHYISAPPNPPAQLALLERFAALLDVELDLARLAVTAAAWREKVDEVARRDPEVASYVEKLEEAYDLDAGGRVTGDEQTADQHEANAERLAAELEEFLREELGGDEGPG